jgi:hypothetical protein
LTSQWSEFVEADEDVLFMPCCSVQHQICDSGVVYQVASANFWRAVRLSQGRAFQPKWKRGALVRTRTDTRVCAIRAKSFFYTILLLRGVIWKCLVVLSQASVGPRLTVQRVEQSTSVSTSAHNHHPVLSTTSVHPVGLF